jgi:hypothetical protein
VPQLMTLSAVERAEVALSRAGQLAGWTLSCMIAAHRSLVQRVGDLSPRTPRSGKRPSLASRKTRATGRPRTMA